MAAGPIRIWNEWATQILILLSFALQIFLFVFARTRRRGSSAVLRILLWMSYLMADSTAVYTLGHLSISGSLHKEKLAVFWAPFLLVHLVSQDSITAYALEDNQLWPRYLLNLIVQASGVAYVLYKHIAEIPTLLGLATGLMFFVGVIKDWERIWALKCATSDSIRGSVKTYRCLPTYYCELPPRGPMINIDEHDEEEPLLFAQAMLPLCKGAMVDFPVALLWYWSSDTESGTMPSYHLWDWNWKATCKVVEMELFLMYDILYTKALVIHTWYGYLFLLIFPLAAVAVLLLFQLSGDRDGYSKTDVAITYILLVGAFLLDMASLLSALGSTWTSNFLLTRDWSKLGLVILYLRRHVKAAGGNRGWSGSIGQFNLLNFCSRVRMKQTNRVAKMLWDMGLEDWWTQKFHSEIQVISEDVKDLVLIHVWQALKNIHDDVEPRDGTQSTPAEKGVEKPKAMMPTTGSEGFGPELYDSTARRRRKLAKALAFGAELQEAILKWHVCTEIFFSVKFYHEVSTTYLEAIKALSNYMLFLIAIHPDTIPGLELCSLYEATRDALEKIWHARPQWKRWEELAMTLKGMRRGSGESKSDYILSHGSSYGRLLPQLVDSNKPLYVVSSFKKSSAVAMHKLELLIPDLESSCTGGAFSLDKVLQLIMDTWVRLLIAVSVRCSRDAHARQISRGCELTTVVWLMEEHAGVFFTRSTGFDRDAEA